MLDMLDSELSEQCSMLDSKSSEQCSTCSTAS